MSKTKTTDFYLKKATKEDVPLILDFINALAKYEKLSDVVVATEELLAETLFGECSYAEVLIGYEREVPAAFALFFHNYSTFLARPGIYLEDLFVKPEYRRRGYGKVILSELAKIAVERKCGRLEWAVLDWNTPAIEFYKSLGAVPMDEWTIFRLSGRALERLGKSS
ncbi:MAG TPA: GNAT family N-acetyltransferase [Bacteroidetes bacterium]|nr:GNAT family N-acetyltransferase [Bacteroidota bacterium]